MHVHKPTFTLGKGKYRDETNYVVITLSRSEYEALVSNYSKCRKHCAEVIKEIEGESEVYRP